jgi:putative methyltransferase (TIGR04325 family)
MVILEHVHQWVAGLASMPGLTQALAAQYEQRFARNTTENLFRGVYPSFEAAAASAPKSRPMGYDNPDAALMYRDLLHTIYPSDWPVLFWLQQCFAQGSSRVFELGGHIGISYYAYQAAMTYPQSLRWVVSDVPAVMDRGAAFAHHKDALGKLSFEADFAQAAEADVFMALGVLQYLPETLGQRLRSLRRLPAHVIVNLTPLHSDAAPKDNAGRPPVSSPPLDGTYFTLQSIGTAFCPSWATPCARPGPTPTRLAKFPSIRTTACTITTAFTCSMRVLEFEAAPPARA